MGKCFELQDRLIGVEIKNGLIGVMLSMIVLTGMPARSDVWGIEIPANFGKWFIAIKTWYLDNQELIGNARKLYVQYQRAHQAYDLVQGLAAPEFRERWVDNIQTLAVANAAYFVTEELIEGSFKGFFQQLLGLDEKNAVVTANMQMFALEVLQFENIFVNLLPDELIVDPIIPHDAWVASAARVMRERRFHRSYEDIRNSEIQALYLDFMESNLQMLRDHPLSPMRPLTQKRVFELLFNRGDPFHTVRPQRGELVFDLSGRVLEFRPYIARRILSQMWLNLGDILRDKLIEVEAWLELRSMKIRAAARETRELVDLIQDLYFGFANLTADSGSGGSFATALDMLASGTADQVGESESRTNGFISSKLDAVVARAESVDAKIQYAVSQIQRVLNNIPPRRIRHSVYVKRMGGLKGKPIGFLQNQNEILQGYLAEGAL